MNEASDESSKPLSSRNYDMKAFGLPIKEYRSVIADALRLVSIKPDENTAVDFTVELRMGLAAGKSLADALTGALDKASIPDALRSPIKEAIVAGFDIEKTRHKNRHRSGHQL